MKNSEEEVEVDEVIDQQTTLMMIFPLTQKTKEDDMSEEPEEEGDLEDKVHDLEDELEDPKQNLRNY